MLPSEVDEELNLLLDHSLVLPSTELLDYAYDRSWIGYRHIIATANLQDCAIRNNQQRALIYGIQLRLIRGWIKEKRDRSEAL